MQLRKNLEQSDPYSQAASETLAYKIQTSGNYPEESIEHSEQGESFKSRKTLLFRSLVTNSILSYSFNTCSRNYCCRFSEAFGEVLTPSFITKLLMWPHKFWVVLLLSFNRET
jgi:hypothetical protein